MKMNVGRNAGSVDGFSAGQIHCTNQRGVQIHVLKQIFISNIKSLRTLIHKFWLDSTAAFPWWSNVICELYPK